MGIDLVPVPPIRDLSTPQAVQRLMAYLHEQASAMQRLSDNADTPTAPTAIAVRQGAGKIVEITVTFAEPADLQWGSTELWRNTTNSVATATLIKTEKTHDFHDVNVSYGSTYYYWARVVSASNSTLVSGWSPSSGHSITVSQVVTADVADANITTAKVADGHITTAKVADANITTAKVANNAVTGAKIGTGSNGVATDNVVDNAITVGGSYSNDASFNATTTEQIIATITVSTNGGAVTVDGKCEVQLNASSSANNYLRLRKDSASGTILDESRLQNPATAAVVLWPASLTGRDTSPSGNQTYVLTAIEGSADTLILSYRRLKAEDLKK